MASFSWCIVHPGKVSWLEGGRSVRKNGSHVLLACSTYIDAVCAALEDIPKLRNASAEGLEVNVQLDQERLGQRIPSLQRTHSREEES